MAWLLMLTATPETQLAAGQAAYEALEYEAAAFEFMSVMIDPVATDEERLQAHLGAGIANRVLGKDTDARLNFLYVLKRRPTYTLPPDTPPKVQFLFEAVRQEVLGSPVPQPAVAPRPPSDKNDDHPRKVREVREVTPSVERTTPEVHPLTVSGFVVAGVGTTLLVGSMGIVLLVESALLDPTLSITERADFQAGGKIFLATSVALTGITAIGGAMAWAGTQ